MILWTYPELEYIEGRKAQLGMLARANLVNAYIFAGLILLLTLFLPDMMESASSRVFGLSGATNDIVTASVYITLMAGIFSILMVFGVKRARRIMRVELAAAGHEICIVCGYDLRSLTEPRCPECGTPFGRPDE